MIITHQLSMAATGWTPWVDARHAATMSLWTDCGAVNTPVGVITLELSNDPQCAVEMGDGTAPASTAAKFVGATPTAATGDSWATGYNGSGAKKSIATISVTSGWVRLKYTKTSGGVGDTLNVYWHAAERWNQ